MNAVRMNTILSGMWTENDNKNTGIYCIMIIYVIYVKFLISDQEIRNHCLLTISSLEDHVINPDRFLRCLSRNTKSLIPLPTPKPPVLQALIHDYQTDHLFMFHISFGSKVCVWNYIFIIILSLTPLIQLRLRKQNKSKTRLVKSYAHININLL